MQLKKISLWIVITLVIVMIISLTLVQKSTTTNEKLVTEVNGPAVLLFKGDNSPGCRAIDKVISDAEIKYKHINFMLMDWSDKNPLIKKYQVRFLPTVVFINNNNKEVKRIVGESPAVKKKLEQTVDQLESLLRN